MLQGLEQSVEGHQVVLFGGSRQRLLDPFMARDDPGADLPDGLCAQRARVAAGIAGVFVVAARTPACQPGIGGAGIGEEGPQGRLVAVRGISQRVANVGTEASCKVPPPP